MKLVSGHRISQKNLQDQLKINLFSFSMIFLIMGSPMLLIWLSVTKSMNTMINSLNNLSLILKSLKSSKNTMFHSKKYSQRKNFIFWIMIFLTSQLTGGIILCVMDLPANYFPNKQSSFSFHQYMKKMKDFIL